MEYDFSPVVGLRQSFTGNDVAFFTKAFEILAECMLKKT